MITEGKPFHWFGGASFTKLVAEAIEVTGKPNARLEIHEHEGKPLLRFAADSYAGPPINESHVCPIDCP